MKFQKDILKRFVSNRFSFNDYLTVSSYFRNEEHSETLEESLSEEWDQTNSEVKNDQLFNQMLDQLHHKIGGEYQQEPPFRSKAYHLLARIAAILILPALFTIAVLSYQLLSPKQSDSYVEIHAPLSSRTKFQLPDGTQGWLNSGSYIKYPVNFAKRQVEVSGEVWFDVVHLDSKDFKVITPFFDIKVLGTKFNVLTTNQGENASVILEQGKVAILDKNQQKVAELIPDQQITYDKSTQKLQIKSIDSKTYTSWKDGILRFKEESMAEIARRLERSYNAEITLHGDSLKSSIFRATFRDESLTEICQSLSEVAPIRYSIVKGAEQADGTFSKNKVEMWLVTK